MSHATTDSSPVALVTGTSTGVGLHTALRLAQAGFRVLATMRDRSRQGVLLEGAAAAGVQLSVLALDVADPASIRAGVAQALAQVGRIDVLVNNAGAGFLGSLEQTSDEALRRTMEVNFFGVWHTTQAVLPQMRERGSGRIISVSSVGGLIGQPFNEAYCAAKFAVEGMMEGFAPIARRLGLHVSLIEPGPINTQFVANVRAALATDAGFAPPYDAMLAAYTGASSQVFAKFGQSGDDIAQIIVEVAQAKAPHLRYVTSDFARQVVKPKVVDYSGDSVVEAFAARMG